jgi:hypothetical protein
VRITGVRFEHAGAHDDRSWLLPDEALAIHVAYEAVEPTPDVQFGIAIYDDEGRLVFGSNTTLLGLDLSLPAGRGEIVFDFARVPLLDGTYPVTLAVESRDAGSVYDWHEQRYSFAVVNTTRTAGIVSLPMSVRVSGE